MCKFDAKQAKFEEDDYNVSHRRTREFGAERGSSSVAKNAAEFRSPSPDRNSGVDDRHDQVK